MLPTGDVDGALSEAQLAECGAAMTAAGSVLRSFSTAEIAEGLAEAAQGWVAGRWSDFASDCAAIAVESSYWPAMVEWSLRDLARRLTANTMIALVEAELGSREPFASARTSAGLPCARAATAPSLLFTVLAETVPPVAIETIVLGLLARAPHVIKTASRERAVARQFLWVLRQARPDLAAHVAVVGWRGGGDAALDARACDLASVVVAYGSNASVDAIRIRSRFPTRFVGYGHRVSFAVVGPSTSGDKGNALKSLVEDIALDVAAYDQRGCMSPNCVFVSRSAPWSSRELASTLATHGFAVIDGRLPRGAVSLETATAIMQQRGVHEFAGEVFEGPSSLVFLHNETTFPSTMGARTIHVVPYDDLRDIERALCGLHGAISTVGLWCTESDRDTVTERLTRLGARRICRIGRMQRPVFVRDHDGRPRIGDWVEWTDVEPF